MVDPFTGLGRNMTPCELDREGLLRQRIFDRAQVEDAIYVCMVRGPVVLRCRARSLALVPMEHYDWLCERAGIEKGIAGSTAELLRASASRDAGGG